MQLVKFVIGAIIIFLYVFTAPVYSESLWRDKNVLYSDNKGLQKGDIVRVIIVEEAQASQQNKTSRSKNVGAGINLDLDKKNQGNSIFDVLGKYGIGGESKYDGDNATIRKGNLKSDLSVKIIRVTRDGNLIIRGNKIVRINNEVQELELTGEIRPEDISPKNTVLSTYIADANIKFKGKLDLSDDEKPGLIVSFFSTIIGWLF